MFVEFFFLVVFVLSLAVGVASHHAVMESGMVASHRNYFLKVVCGLRHIQTSPSEWLNFTLCRR